MTKVKDVINENETLSEHTKCEAALEGGGSESYKPNIKTSKFMVTSGPNILFESRISELEAQLTQANIDYKKLADECAELKRKRAFGGNESLHDTSTSFTDAYKKQIENLQRDKNALEETVKKLQKQVSEQSKELDSQVFSKTQRNRDLAEQANFQKTQADIEIRRLKVDTQFFSKSI